MTKKTTQCNDCGACTTTEASDINYGYYSKLLNKPFDTVSELRAAEAAYNAEQKAKENAAAQKKADAQKVEDAFKALNAARKTYKEDLTQLTTEYTEALKELKDAFELGKKDIYDDLAAAEEAYATALKEFTDKHNQFHLTLKDGDFETTISGSQNKSDIKVDNDIFSIFNSLFNF
jgi:hypothetical protein